MQDPNHEGTNLQESDINLEEVQQIWLDPHRIEFAVPTEDEPRHFTIGKLYDGSYVTVAYIPAPKVRLLFVRKSLTQEIQLYES